MIKFLPLSLVLLLFSCAEFSEDADMLSTEQAALADTTLQAKTLQTQTQQNMMQGIPGLTITPSAYPVDTAFENLDATVTANPNLRVILRLDHSANAAANDLELRPTKLLVFGNPNLGTPLMQINPFAGLDLPQKVLFYEDAAGDVFARYNSVDYLAERHGLQGAPQLDIIRGALKGLVEGATGGAMEAANPADVPFREGIEKRSSSLSFEETYSRLRDAIDANPNLRIISEINHTANAESVGLSLTPTRLIVFGNPLVGTPFMQAQQTIGIDLPQKMLVVEDAEGRVFVAFNSINWLARQRHSIATEDARIETVTGVLRSLAEAATR